MTREIHNQDQELEQRIRRIMLLRVFLLTGFVGLLLTFQERLGITAPIEPLCMAIGSGLGRFDSGKRHSLHHRGYWQPHFLSFLICNYCIQCHATQGRGLSGGVRRYYHLWGTGRPGIFWGHYSGLFVSGIEGIFWKRLCFLCDFSKYSFLLHGGLSKQFSFTSIANS